MAGSSSAAVLRGPACALRAATVADEGFFAALHAEVRRAEVAAFGWPAELADTFLRQQHLFREQGFRAQFPGSAPEVIERDRRRIGRRWVARTAEALVLVDLALLEAERGQGVGRSLLEALQHEAAASGLPLRLSVLADSRARALYARAGFVETDHDEPYVQMEWRLRHEDGDGR